MRIRDGTVVRTERQRALVWWLVVPGVLLCAVMVVVGITLHQAHPSLWRRVFVVCFFGFGGAGLATLGYRVSRTGVLVEADKVVVRNIWRTIEVAWDDIDAFAVAPFGLWWTTGYVHLRDGANIITWGIQGRNRFLFNDNGWTSAAIARLNGELAQRRGGSIADDAGISSS